MKSKRLVFQISWIVFKGVQLMGVSYFAESLKGFDPTALFSGPVVC